MLTSIKAVLASEGPAGFVRALRRRIRAPRAQSYPKCIPLVDGRQGLEIGGPSGIFTRTGLLPVYRLARTVDNCTFASSTVWDAHGDDGASYRVDGRDIGRRYVAEATRLDAFEDGAYDFVLSSHMLEHTTNPLGAVQEWLRVLRPGGGLVVVVPHRDGTFDHRRPITSLDHLIEDFATQTPEDDLTHLPEILERHDVSRDSGVQTVEDLRQRAMRNYEFRCLHHHVFDTHLVVQMLDHMGLQIEAVEAQRPYHIIVVAQKAMKGETTDSRQFLSTDAEYARESPFPTDRARRDAAAPAVS